MSALTKQELFGLQQKWLSLFDNTGVHWMMNSETKDELLKPKGHFEWVFYTHEDAFDLNWSNMLSHTYTPNGNFALANKGKRTGDRSIRTEKEAQQEVFAFVVDLDRKSLSHPDAPERSRDDLLEILKRERLPINYITETPGGWHMYMFVDPKDRKRIDKKMYSEIIDSFAIRLDGDRLKDLARLMRIPFSQYYGGWIHAGSVKLFRVDVDTAWEYEFEEVTSPQQINLEGITFWTFEQLSQLYDNIHQEPVMVNTAADNRFFDKDWGSGAFTEKCNMIRFPELFEHLKKYPRPIDWGWWFEYPILVDNTRIAFERADGDWQALPRKETDWYRFNQEKNYVHNFTPHYSIDERPKGEPYAFIRHWFGMNMLKVYEFFESEFELFRRVEKQELLMSIEAARGVIDFSITGVTYTVNTETKNGPSTKVLRLMHTWCYPKGVVRTTWNTSKSETADENIYIVLSNTSGDDTLIPYHTDKRAFNKRHGTHGLQFIGDEVAMNDFYHAIWETAKRNPSLVPTFEYLGTNGFYADWFLYGKNWFLPDATPLHISEVTWKYFGNTVYDMSFPNKSYIDVKDFYEKLLKLFPKRIALVSFLTYLTDMAGINFWEPVITKINSTKIIPPLFLSGITKSGKSTLNLLMKEWFGINPNNRTVALKSITTQPLQQFSTDNTVLHLEEYTGMIKADMGGTIRDIINKQSKIRGNADGSNSTFFFRSNLLIDWEQLPEEESVQNRMIIVPFFENDKCGTNTLIADTRKSTYIFDFIRLIYFNWKNVSTYYKEGLTVLASYWLSSRELELYSFIYVMNKICNLAPVEELVQCIRENTTALRSLGDSDPLDEILSDIIFTMKLTPTMYEGMWADGKDTYLSIPIPYNIIARYKIKLIECQKKYSGAVAIENSCLILRKNNIDLIDKKIEKFSFRAILRGPNVGWIFG